jgi:hypothetical protein
MKSRTAALTALLAVATSPAWAWERAGFKSGMTVDEIQRSLPPSYVIQNLQEPGRFTSIAIVRQQPLDVLATMLLCRGRLFVLNKNIDPETDYLPEISEAIRSYGQPETKIEKSSAQRIPSGYISELTLRWITNKITGERFSISLSPQLRDGNGQLVASRSASIMYELPALYGSGCK